MTYTGASCGHRNKAVGTEERLANHLCVTTCGVFEAVSVEQANSCSDTLDSQQSTVSRAAGPMQCMGPEFCSPPARFQSHRHRNPLGQGD